MIFTFLINTLHFKFDSSLLGKSIHLHTANLYILQDSKWRSENYYDTQAVADIGNGLLSTTKFDYVFATNTSDFIDYTDEKTELEVKTELARMTELFCDCFDGMLFYLWFVKDNSISYDFSYSYAKYKNYKVGNLNINQKILTASDCTYRDVEFSEDEINYGFYVWERALEICKNMGKNRNQVSVEDVSKGAFMTMESLGYTNYTRVERALFFLGIARTTRNIIYKVTSYVHLIESLFSAGRNEIISTLRLRVALYMGNDLEEREYLRGLIKDAYEVRSAYVHGSAVYNGEKKGAGLFTIEKLNNISKQLDNLSRAVLARVIHYDSEIFQDDNKLDDMFIKFVYQPNYYR